MEGEVAMAKTEKYEDYQVSSDLDTLIRANEILDDKSKLPKIQAEYKKRQEALKDVGEELAFETKVKKNLNKAFGKK